MSIQKYEISNLKIECSSDSDIKITESFVPFLKEESLEEVNYRIEFCEIEKLPEQIGNLIAKEKEYSVYLDDTFSEKRLYHDYKNAKQPYALTVFDFTNKKVQVRYLPIGRKFFAETGNSFFHIGWEKILAFEQRMLLHASCIETQKKGILFSGPSGVGKSTQADLWCRIEQANLINGDRVVLNRSEFGWMAYGSPYAGSSKCYVNDKCKIEAIVLLKQAKECNIRCIKGVEAFRRVYEGLTINTWDKKFVEFAVDTVTKLISEVPVYELECVPDQSAIEILKKELGW